LDSAGKALWHIVREARNPDADNRAVSAWDSAGEALRHVVREARTLDARDKAGSAWDSTRKALRHNAEKSLEHDAEKALELGATEALDIDIDGPYTEFISEVMLYECAREAESGDDRWVIDSGATTHCTGDISKYESIDQRYRRVLGTPGHRLRTEGKGVAIIPLPEGHARVRDVLYVLRMKGNLLLMQILHRDGIFNEHAENSYRFYRKDRKTLATGRNEGRTSYLESVKLPDALMTRNIRSRKEFANLVQESEWEPLHQRYGHPGTARMHRVAKRLSIEWNDKGIYKTCIKAKSMKKLSKSKILRATTPLERVFMDFWGLHSKGIGRASYYLSIVNNVTRFS
jgi:hypothetical protein